MSEAKLLNTFSFAECSVDAGKSKTFGIHEMHAKVVNFWCPENL